MKIGLKGIYLGYAVCLGLIALILGTRLSFVKLDERCKYINNKITKEIEEVKFLTD